MGTLDVLTARTVPGTASGSGVHWTVRFRAVAEGTGRLDLVDPEARDGDDLPVGGIRWIGGAVSVDL